MRVCPEQFDDPVWRFYPRFYLRFYPRFSDLFTDLFFQAAFYPSLAEPFNQVFWIRLEGQHQAGHAAVKQRWINAMLAALAIDLLDAAAPGLDVASAKEGAGDEGVVGR